MPNLRSTDLNSNEPVVAILVSDLHLRHKAPISRSAEPDWYEAMLRPLKEIDALTRLSHPNAPLPVLYAGDIFHKWNSPAELINFALRYLPHGYAIAGQHDLPMHNLEDIKKSAYWTLVQTERIEHIAGSHTTYISGYKADLYVRGFNWGEPIEPYPKTEPGIRLAMIHHYIWRDCHNKHWGAPIKDKVSNWKKQLKGYDVALFGDNHIGFRDRIGGTYIINCGSVRADNADQKGYQPMVGLLHADGVVSSHFLDTSQDKWLDGANIAKSLGGAVPGLQDVMAEYIKLGGKTENFTAMLRMLCKGTHHSKRMRRVITELLEEFKDD